MLACSGGAASPARSAPPPAASQAAPGGAAAPPISMIRFGVGPLMPTPTDTKTAWEPFFRYLAQQLGAQNYDLVATTDWAGISVAMSGGQVDVAWMGPWGYVLSHNEVGAEAIATAKYDEKPIYYAIMVSQPGNTIRQFPEDAKGKRMSFADVGSTSGWLIPTAWFKKQGIDPREYFQYSEGATHAANEVAVAEKQVDLATDFDRNRTAMIEGGTLPADATAIVWQSDPLPNDAIAVRKGLDPALVERVRTVLLAITPEQAKEILPNHYTGFVTATNQEYASIEEAGVLVGRLQKQ
ncbi:MAG TPA: phosphate/phosphite/phosphonate ABC transporter substrate-binding protein [Chloroflexota bacterium]